MTETGFFSIAMSRITCYLHEVAKVVNYLFCLKAPGGIPYNDLNREAPPKVEAKSVPF